MPLRYPLPLPQAHLCDKQDLCLVCVCRFLCTTPEDLTCPQPSLQEFSLCLQHQSIFWQCVMLFTDTCGSVNVVALLATMHPYPAWRIQTPSCGTAIGLAQMVAPFLSFLLPWEML